MQASGFLSVPSGRMLAPALLPLAVEAAWRLRNWPLLSDLVLQCEVEVSPACNLTVLLRYHINIL
jgi:hypothetical protein